MLIFSFPISSCLIDVLHPLDGFPAADKSWWSRFFYGNNSGANVAAPPNAGGNATWMASCRRRQPQAVQHPFRRRHRQIVQKLMEETSLAEDNNRRATVTVATKEIGTPSGATTDAAADKDTIRRDHESGTHHLNDLIRSY